MAYTKLFQSIITSTVWRGPDATRLVWITLLALADKNGEVQASIPGLAHLAGVNVEDCRTAIASFLAPDPDSRTKDEEGRRIEEIDGGWSLINHAKYRRMASLDEAKEKNRERQARHRERTRRNDGVTDSNANVTQANDSVTHSTDIAEAEEQKHKAKSKSKREPHARPTVDEVKAYCKAVNLPESDGEWFHDRCEGSGWKNNGKPIISWQATIRSWKAQGYMASQKLVTGRNGNHSDTFL